MNPNSPIQQRRSKRIAEAVALYSAGYSLPELSAKIGAEDSTITTWLIRAGVYRFPTQHSAVHIRSADSHSKAAFNKSRVEEIKYWNEMEWGCSHCPVCGITTFRLGKSKVKICGKDCYRKYQNKHRKLYYSKYRERIAIEASLKSKARINKKVQIEYDTAKPVCKFCGMLVSIDKFKRKRTVKFCSAKCGEDYDRKIRTKLDPEYAIRRKLSKTKARAKRVASGAERDEKRMYYQNNVLARIAKNLRSRLRLAVLRSGGSNSDSTMNLTGCTRAQLLSHLELKFTRGMSLSNYGKWHIDHIVPCSRFDLRNADEQRKCFHFTNLQPLWELDNISKGGSLPPNCQPMLHL